MIFRPIQIGTREFNLQELTFNHGIKLSVIEKSLNEHRLSEFLRYSITDDIDPLSLNIQERYFLLLKYLEQQKTSSILHFNGIDFNDFYYENAYLESYSLDGISIRQLNGRDLEFLEKKCTSRREWIATAIAIQLSYEDQNKLPDIDSNLLQEDYENAIKNRVAKINQKRLSEFDTLYDDFLRMSLFLMSKVHYEFTDNGIALKKNNERGTDDALYRFCTLIGRSKFFK